MKTRALTMVPAFVFLALSLGSHQAVSQSEPVLFGQLPVKSRFNQLDAYSVDPTTLASIDRDAAGVKLVRGKDGSAAQFAGPITVVSKRVYRVDPSHTYRLGADVQVEKADPAKEGAAGFLGLMTYGEDGKLLEGGPGTHRYAGWSGKVVKPEENWVRVEGEITGAGDETMFQFRPGTAYVRIVAILNYESPEAITNLDNLIFEEVK